MYEHIYVLVISVGHHKENDGDHIYEVRTQKIYSYKAGIVLLLILEYMGNTL